MKRPIPPELIIKTRVWLGKDGHDFFSDIKKKHGKINACWSEGDIPHAVHFREGMQIRNFMRMSDLCDGWDSMDYDDNWVELIESALKSSFKQTNRFEILKSEESVK